MNIIGIVPARMASSRFPGKPLAKIHGMPMIGHTFLRAKMSKELNNVFVATCDEEIKNYIHSIDGDIIMTSNKHPSAADRTVEAIEKYEKKYNLGADIVVLIQGDDPMITPETIDKSINLMLAEQNISILTLIRRITDLDEFNDPDIIKVITDLNGNAIYFSREPLPSLKKGANHISIPMYKHVAIILFNKEALDKFSSFPQTPLELVEEIDLIRVIEYDQKIHCLIDDNVTYNVDTPKALKVVEKAMENDTLMYKYL